MSGYLKERWVGRFQDALFKLEHARITERIGDARKAASERLEELRNAPGLHKPERQAISDGSESRRKPSRRLRKHGKETLLNIHPYVPSSAAFQGRVSDQA